MTLIGVVSQEFMDSLVGSNGILSRYRRKESHHIPFLHLVRLSTYFLGHQKKSSSNAAANLRVIRPHLWNSFESGLRNIAISGRSMPK